MECDMQKGTGTYLLSWRLMW